MKRVCVTPSYLKLRLKMRIWQTKLNSISKSLLHFPYVYKIIRLSSHTLTVNIRWQLTHVQPINTTFQPKQVYRFKNADFGIFMGASAVRRDNHEVQVDQELKMKCIGIHIYTTSKQWCESLALAEKAKFCDFGLETKSLELALMSESLGFLVLLIYRMVHYHLCTNRFSMIEVYFLKQSSIKFEL